MIKTIIKTIYFVFISIVLISIILAGWTSYTFIFQSSKSSEIIKVVQDMYVSQKSVLVDVIDLSKILIKDTSESITSEQIRNSVETEYLADIEENSQLGESSIAEDNGENPLGIVIEPSLPEVNETSLPDLTADQLLIEQKDVLSNEMKMEIDMN